MLLNARVSKTILLLLLLGELLGQSWIKLVVTNELVWITIVLHQLDVSLVEVAVCALELTCLVEQELFEERHIKGVDVQSLSFEHERDE